MRQFVALTIAAMLVVSCSIASRLTIENRAGEAIAVVAEGERISVPVDGESTVRLGMQGGAFTIYSSTRRFDYELSTDSVLGTPFRTCTWGVCVRVRVDDRWRIHLIPKAGAEGEPQPAGFPLIPSNNGHAV